jgi:hypothetical protein
MGRAVIALLLQLLRVVRVIVPALDGFAALQVLGLQSLAQ